MDVVIGMVLMCFINMMAYCIIKVVDMFFGFDKEILYMIGYCYVLGTFAISISLLMSMSGTS